MNKAAATLHFSELLLTLLKGKTTLLDAFHILARDGIKRQVRESAISLIQIMKKGKKFSLGLKEMKNASIYYEPLYLTLIDAAEATGNLEKVLELIVNDLDRKKKTKENLIGILIYPVIIIFLAILGSIIIIYKVLPLFTRNGMLSDGFAQSAILGIIFAGIVLFSGAFILFFVYFKIFHNDSPEFRMFYLLNLLLENKITLSDALSYCIASFGHTKFGYNLVTVKNDIISGNSFSLAFNKIKKLSPYVHGWLSVAEKNGNLIEACQYIKNHYEVKDKHKREIATKLMEPALIILTGIYILIIILNVVLPLFTSIGGIL